MNTSCTEQPRATVLLRVTRTWCLPQAFFLFLLALVLSAGPASAQSLGPEVFDKVAFDQRLNEQIPLDLTFRDERGRAVRLSRYFGDKPVVLNLVYFQCPRLCNMQLDGLTRALKTISFVPGEDFELLTVSFDPTETPQLAHDKKAAYLAQYGRNEAAGGWHFLTGDERQIRRLTEAVGFRYTYDAQRQVYAHASGIVVLTPDGTISRYFYGVEYPSKDLRLGLVEASAGRIGSAVDQLLLMCYHYDPTTGKYGLIIMNVIRLLGFATVLLLGSFVGLMLYRDRSSRHIGLPESGEMGRSRDAEPHP